MINYEIDKSLESHVLTHLEKCKNTFIPPLDKTVGLINYSRKLCQFSTRFEAWHNDELVGLIAAYFNDEKFQKGFITNVSVLNSFQGMGIAQSLIKNCIYYAKKHNFLNIELEVNQMNIAAISLYEKYDFQVIEQFKDTVKMNLELNKPGDE